MATNRANILGDPSAVETGEGLYDYCMAGHVFSRTAGLIDQSQAHLRKCLIAGKYGRTKAMIITLPMRQAAELLRAADAMLQRTWRVACKNIPELASGGSTTKASGPKAFKP